MSLHLYNQYHFIPSVYLGIKQLILFINGKKITSTQTVESLRENTYLVKQTKYYKTHKLVLDVPKMQNNFQPKLSLFITINPEINLINVRPRQANLEERKPGIGGNMPSMFINKYIPL